MTQLTEQEHNLLYFRLGINEALRISGMSKAELSGTISNKLRTMSLAEMKELAKETEEDLHQLYNVYSILLANE